MPDQIHRQHFSLKRPQHCRAIFNGGTITNAEFTIAINSGGPHRIANVIDHFGIRLLPFSQAFNHMVEHTDRFIGPA